MYCFPTFLNVYLYETWQSAAKLPVWRNTIDTGVREIEKGSPK